MTKITPFSYINAIFDGTEIEIDDKAYNQYIINKGLSFHKDCIFLVNEINALPGITNKQHYDFYKYAIRKYKRPYMKWINKEQSEKVELIKQFFHYSTEKALGIVDLISEDNFNDIKEQLNKGGIP